MVTVSLTDFGENKVKHVWIVEDSSELVAVYANKSLAVLYLEGVQDDLEDEGEETSLEIEEDWATLEGPFGPIVFATKFAVSGAEVC